LYYKPSTDPIDKRGSCIQSLLGTGWSQDSIQHGCAWVCSRQSGFRFHPSRSFGGKTDPWRRFPIDRAAPVCRSMADVMRPPMSSHAAFSGQTQPLSDAADLIKGLQRMTMTNPSPLGSVAVRQPSGGLQFSPMPANVWSRGAPPQGQIESPGGAPVGDESPDASHPPDAGHS
jgi:hypothetical protein